MPEPTPTELRYVQLRNQLASVEREAQEIRLQRARNAATRRLITQELKTLEARMARAATIQTRSAA